MRRLESASQAALRPASGSDSDSWRRLHLVTVGRLIARAALRREESRGGHFRADFPDATIYTGKSTWSIERP